jgi:spore maturation protein CgeB
MVRALAERGHAVTFFEPDAYGRQENRDIDPPDWCEVVVYAATDAAVREVSARAGGFDVAIKASGVGHADDALFEGVLDAAGPATATVFWDVDAPATLAGLAADPDLALHRHLARADMVLTYGGGEPVVAAYRGLGVSACVPIYNALDPSVHHPVPAEPRLAADLSFLGNRLPDREARVGTFFLDAARRLPGRRFLLGGSGWDGAALPGNVTMLGHVGTADHNAFNASARAVLNISRDSMAAVGHSPATRVFEAAGAGACIITDAWEGIERFLDPGEEILVARDGRDVADFLAVLDEPIARRIGARARERVLAEHTYDRRAADFEAALAPLVERKRDGAAA